MKIALDVSPLSSDRFLKHRVRGTGFYIENLKKSLLTYFPNNHYQFFGQGESLPKGIDIVHYPYFEPFFLSLPLGKHKTVVTVHDLTPLAFPQFFPPGIKGKIKWQIQKQRLRKITAIITDSEASKKDIEKFTGIQSSKIHVIYLAPGEEFKKIQDSKGTQQLRNKYRLPQKFVLYVGDGTWNKNLPRLLEAGREADVDLVMVGKALKDEEIDKTNPWNQDLLRVQQMAKQNPKVHLLGFVETEELVKLYNMATVFIMPSLYEGFGLPVLEAMSCGCPVITSKEGSLPEIAGQAAFYIDAYDKESIAKGIKKMLSDKKLQEECSKRGLKQAQSFSWEKTAMQTIRVYEEANK